MRRILLPLLLLLPSLLPADQSLDELLRALEIAAYWDRKLEERFPSTFNHILSTGYFVTHSARMTEEGEMGIGMARAPPYLNINGRIQPFFFLEFTANYRIFRGCEDPSIGKYGFGDYADRGANFKAAIVTPEQSFYRLPGIAFGIDDFMGSKKFTNYFIVGTQVWPDWGFEISFGWGSGTYRNGPSKGFFGGFNLFPFIQCNKWIKGLGVAAEIDPTNYSEDPHPKGRISHTPINFGAKYNFSNIFELSTSCIRGDAFAAAGSLHYNWGKSRGFIPKFGDPCIYSAPVDHHPLGCFRPPEVMVQSLSYALEDQGFQLTRAWVDCSTLWLRLIVCRYRQEEVVRCRLQQILAALTPSNIQTVVVQIESNGLLCQQYVYEREFLLRYADHSLTQFEMEILSPREEASPCPPADLIFHRRCDLWRAHLSPRMENFFGSVKGKWKYDFGLKLKLEGFLPYNWFYEIQVSNTLFSNIRDLGDFDLFFPSQLPNVATDFIRYRQSHALSWDRLYLQKSWNFGCGYFGRLSGGYFQVNYAGIAAEALWYPAHSYIAIGLEGAIVKKRKYTGLGFQSEIRHFEGKRPVFSPCTTFQQYFLDFYMEFPDLRIFIKASLGQFLAGDKGVRLELTRYFENGIRLTGWITYTDAHDKIHERNYYDRGIAVEIPFDFFFKCSSRKIWSYGMAAWLRDAGYSISTGRELFETLNRERR
ncbi:MAG: YjbH domain-containing protein [Chlamydiales bacterium]|nr:YjbH domain-containing protein [Chlamydiales bacterium]